jgi:hypothetical protein
VTARPTLFVPRAEDALPFDALVPERVWTAVQGADVAHFPWHRHGTRHRTTVRLQYTATHLLAAFDCEDRHISSLVTELNGPVWTDSCVELFFCPAPALSGGYFNFEINAAGTFLLGFGQGRHDRAHIDPSGAKDIAVWHSIPGPTKDESADDHSWRIVTALPFLRLEALAGTPLHPAPGTRWTGNAYRCGGRTNPQHACWAPIPTPVPDFHQPSSFGNFLFT